MNGTMVRVGNSVLELIQIFRLQKSFIQGVNQHKGWHLQCLLGVRYDEQSRMLALSTYMRPRKLPTIVHPSPVTELKASFE